MLGGTLLWSALDSCTVSPRGRCGGLFAPTPSRQGALRARTAAPAARAPARWRARGSTAVARVARRLAVQREQVDVVLARAPCAPRAARARRRAGSPARQDGARRTRASRRAALWRAAGSAARRSTSGAGLRTAASRRSARSSTPNSSAQTSCSSRPAAVSMRPRPCCSNRVASRVCGELLQLHGDGGLREVQLFGGARDAAQARDRLEHHQLREQPVPEETAQAERGIRLLRRVLRSGRVARGPRSRLQLCAARATGDCNPELTIAPRRSYSPAGTAVRSIPDAGRTAPIANRNGWHRNSSIFFRSGRRQTAPQHNGAHGPVHDRGVLVRAGRDRRHRPGARRRQRHRHRPRRAQPAQGCSSAGHPLGHGRRRGGAREPHRGGALAAAGARA